MKFYASTIGTDGPPVSDKGGAQPQDLNISRIDIDLVDEDTREMSIDGFISQLRGVLKKGCSGGRIKIKIGELWETPSLHVLLTKEDDVIVARCLDFSLSSHGNDEKDALKSLAAVIKEYLLTASENNAIDTIFDSANGKYWRMYNELETQLNPMARRLLFFHTLLKT